MSSSDRLCAHDLASEPRGEAEMSHNEGTDCLWTGYRTVVYIPASGSAFLVLVLARV